MRYCTVGKAKAWDVTRNRMLSVHVPGVLQLSFLDALRVHET